MVWDAMRPPMVRPAFVKSEAILLQKFVFFFTTAMLLLFKFCSAMAACYKTLLHDK